VTENDGLSRRKSPTESDKSDCDVYRTKQVSMSQPGRCQGFDGATIQIVVFRAIELKSLLSIQLACNRKAFSIFI